MESDWKKEMHALIASVKNKKEAEELLTSLLTPMEYDEIIRRWQILKGLIEGESQRSIRDRLKISIATVTRGSRELKYGNGMLQKFYKRLSPGRSVSK